MGLSVLSFLLNFMTRHNPYPYPRDPIIMSPFVGYRFTVSSELSVAKVVIIFYTTKYLKEKVNLQHKNRR